MGHVPSRGGYARERWAMSPYRESSAPPKEAPEPIPLWQKMRVVSLLILAFGPVYVQWARDVPVRFWGITPLVVIAVASTVFWIKGWGDGEDDKLAQIRKLEVEIDRLRKR